MEVPTFYFCYFKRSNPRLGKSLVGFYSIFRQAYRYNLSESKLEELSQVLNKPNEVSNIRQLSSSTEKILDVFEINSEVKKCDFFDSLNKILMEEVAKEKIQRC